MSISDAILSTVAIAFVGIPLAYAALQVFSEWRAEARVSRRVAATRRLEIMDGKEWSVVSRNLLVAKERRSGRVGVILTYGSENDPNIVQGRMTRRPRWIRIQFINRSGKNVGQAHWRKFDKFESIGAIKVDFLTRKTGWFSSESFCRLPSDIVATAERHSGSA